MNNQSFHRDRNLNWREECDHKVIDTVASDKVTYDDLSDASY